MTDKKSAETYLVGGRQGNYRTGVSRLADKEMPESLSVASFNRSKMRVNVASSMPRAGDQKGKQMNLEIEARRNASVTLRAEDRRH